jgi:hypothetical protein
MKLFCKILGHKYGFLQLLIAEIKSKAINKAELDLCLKCERCGDVRDLRAEAIAKWRMK